MSGILDSKLTLRHLLVLGIVIATFAISSGTFASGDSTNSAFSAGSVRMSSAHASAYLSIDYTATAPLLVLKTTFNVPSGKTAEVQATFSATLAHGVDASGYAYCDGAFTLDGATSDSHFQPGSIQLFGGGTASEPDELTVAMTGFRQNIGAGNHVVNVYFAASYAGCTIEDRTLNVLVNIH